MRLRKLGSRDEGKVAMPRWDRCVVCHKACAPKQLTAVQVSRASRDCPADYEWICRPCGLEALEHAERDEERASLRGYSDEDRERI
jgi:hypothetical protein